MKKLMKSFAHYIRKEEGLVTIEWVGIAAVVVLAAIVISAGIMQGATDLGTDVISQQGTIGTAVSAATPAADLDFTP